MIPYSSLKLIFAPSGGFFIKPLSASTLVSKLALKYFSKGLKIFLSNIVGKDIIEETPIDVGYVLPKTPDSLGEVKIYPNFLKRLYKKEFKGLDKFINIK